MIVAEEKIFIPSYNKKIISLDAKTGNIIWEKNLADYAPRRGMVYLGKKIIKNQNYFFHHIKV